MKLITTLFILSCLLYKEDILVLVRVPMVLSETLPLLLTGGPAAQAYTLVQAKLLAATAIDLYCTPRHVDTAKEQFAKYTREGL
jgi:hypothetical protein